ncbi:MAG: C-terminal binding protein [Victivallales bacterium]|nr:C-terminal binding protein [Victivallales bacterium]
MTIRNQKFIVAMIAAERNQLPTWVTQRLDEIPNIEVRYALCKTEAQFLAIASDADMIWTRHINYVLTPEILPKLTRCKAIFRSGSGMDGYPVEAAAKLGIHCCNSPESISESVAEHAVSLLFSFIRQIPQANDALHTHKTFQLSDMRWHISGRTLGLVGFGRIARRIVEMLAGFRMCILCFDPFADSQTMRDMNVQPASLEKLLKDSDYISLHCPLTEQTFHLIGEKQFAMMKSNAILVNTSRGDVIDEEALINVLRENRIGGAAIDVTHIEPLPSDSPLLKLPNLIVTPHNAAFSCDFEKNFYELSIQVILECQHGDYRHSMNSHLMK